MKLSTAIKAFIMFMMFPLLILVSVGCSILDPLQDNAADKIASGVVKYCQEIDETNRLALRTRINDKLDGQSVVVTCNERR